MGVDLCQILHEDLLTIDLLRESGVSDGVFFLPELELRLGLWGGVEEESGKSSEKHEDCCKFFACHLVILYEIDGKRVVI